MEPRSSSPYPILYTNWANPAHQFHAYIQLKIRITLLQWRPTTIIFTPSEYPVTITMDILQSGYNVVMMLMHRKCELRQAKSLFVCRTLCYYSNAAYDQLQQPSSCCAWFKHPTATPWNSWGLLSWSRNSSLFMKPDGPLQCWLSRDLRGCIEKFPDWPPGARTAKGTALCH
jgi:hypothetical protein